MASHTIRSNLDFPVVLVVAAKILEVRDIMPALEQAKRLKRPLLIFSELMEDDPLSILAFNNMKGSQQSCAVDIPFLVGIEKEVLQDIAVLTGATLIDN